MEEMLNIISKGMTKKTAIILMLTVVSILLSFSTTKTLAEELPVLVLFSLLTGFYIALYVLAFDIVCWLFNQINTIRKSLLDTSITTFAKFKLLIQNNKKQRLAQRLFIEKMGENEVKYLSLFFGEPKSSIKNNHGLIPKEVMEYFDDLCGSKLMVREVTTDGASYVFFIDKRFSKTLQKRIFLNEQVSSSLTLKLTEIQASIVTRGGGLARGNVRT
ncbi:hypothetical protein [Photobacterium atrarenae]|uniref:Superinfection exclusion protein B n=1 Tax=Photobacterium atrarenae TaxID=865757 RepID=A0ABY5GJM1_9GAMM|nr:hypothetical protein [Photobacterium atrarenae]UTV28960.1 hypothetical protein NNL38_06950 [Photobacterium atrarenae]